MGRGVRQKPDRLAEKLLQIRMAFGLSQNEMISRMGLTDELVREEISAFELGKRQPPLRVLLEYARYVGISTDALIDDETDLPERLTNVSRQGMAESKSSSRSKRKR